MDLTVFSSVLTKYESVDHWTKDLVYKECLLTPKQEVPLLCYIDIAFLGFHRSVSHSTQIIETFLRLT